MSLGNLTLNKTLRYSLALSCGLWFAGYAMAEQIASRSTGATANGLSADEEMVLIQACDNADPAIADPSLKQRCEAWRATTAATTKSMLNRWIELESSKPDQRVYVAIPEHADPYNTTSRRIHLRYDYNAHYNPKIMMDPTTQHQVPATVVRTIKLNCRDGETTLVAMHLYGNDSKPDFSKTFDKRKAERILHFYKSPLRLVCSKEYLLPFIPNGEKLAAMQKAEEARKRNVLVPDIVVEVPK